jgi:hypothetical protein
LEPRFGGVGALLFSQCNVAWRRFVWTGGLGCQSFAFLGVFFCQEWLQNLSKIFDLQSSHCLLPPSSHHPVCFLDKSHLTGMKWNLDVVICIFYMDKDTEHFFMCLLAIYNSFQNCLSICPFVHLIIGLFVLLLKFFFFLSSLDILAINPLLDEWL